MIAPDFPDGHLYYIRFKTPKGLFYKIGFSKMSSAEVRFSYGGSENYKMIDKVLMYKYSLRAYDYERELHTSLLDDRAYKGHYLFLKPSEHPLFRDGQTELYREDVLGLDPDYKRPFSFLNLFIAPRNNLVERRLLRMPWHESLRDKMERITYSLFDGFIKEPLFFSRDQFVEQEGNWVLSLFRWAHQNHLTGSLVSDTTENQPPPLPQTKQELLALETLALGWHQVRSIPPEIGQLKNLTTIEFHSSHVISIPDEFYTLPKLTHLDISHSNVQSLSSRIANLTQLEVLDIGHCENLHFLPPELELLPNLKEVRLLREQRGFLPESFRKKTNLLVFVNNDYEDMQRHYLKELAASVKKWKQLRPLFKKVGANFPAQAMLYYRPADISTFLDQSREIPPATTTDAYFS